MNDAVASMPRSAQTASVGSTRSRSSRFWLIFCIRAEPVSMPKYRPMQPASAMRSSSIGLTQSTRADTRQRKPRPRTASQKSSTLRLLTVNMSWSSLNSL